jgi:peptidoglycan biosynthesis protein MviN/MurJ (putative lipid II flippase)
MSEQSAKPKVSDHPVAARQIARARAWGALIGFLLVFWLSRRAGLPFPESGARAIVGGLVLRMLAWGAVVAVWRQLIPAQIAAARQRIAAEHAAARGPQRGA